MKYGSFPIHSLLSRRKIRDIPCAQWRLFYFSFLCWDSRALLNYDSWLCQSPLLFTQNISLLVTKYLRLPSMPSISAIPVGCSSTSFIPNAIFLEERNITSHVIPTHLRCQLQAQARYQQFFSDLAGSVQTRDFHKDSSFILHLFAKMTHRTWRINYVGFIKEHAKGYRWADKWGRRQGWDRSQA